MSELRAEQILVDPRPDYPLQILGTRYNIPAAPSDGYTLIFLHALGMHKESWDIVISHLMDVCRREGTSIIQDIVSIEIPNHGQSAIINEDALRDHFRDTWHTRECARVAHLLLTTKPKEGPHIDFSKRRLIGIGHSIGAAGLFLTHDLLPYVKFETMIVFEPGISVKHNPETDIAAQALTSWTWLRRDVWKSKKAAQEELKSSPMYATWDPRALDLFVKFGLRAHPAAKYPPPFGFKGVTTALTKEQQAASYRSDELVVDALEAYGAVSRKLPVHVIWGSFNDVATPDLQNLLADEKAGRTPASVSHIDNAGHLVIQQQPEEAAEKIYKILASHGQVKTKL